MWEAPKPLLGPQCCRDLKRGAYVQCFVALLGPTPDCARCTPHDSNPKMPTVYQRIISQSQTSEKYNAYGLEVLSIVVLLIMSCPPIVATFLVNDTTLLLHRCLPLGISATDKISRPSLHLLQLNEPLPSSPSWMQ